MEPKAPQDERESFTDYEKIYLHMSRAFAHVGKEHWGLHCVCSIEHVPRKGTTIESSLRQAWAQLLIEYPGLGTRPDGWFKDDIDLSQSAARAKWLDQTFFIESECTVDEIISNAEPCELPGLYYFSPSSEVLFLSQHWRTDALGCCMLLDRLFELLAAAESGTEEVSVSRTANSTSPAMEIAAGAINVEDPETQKFAREYIDAFHAKAVHSGGLPYDGDQTTLPTRTRHRELVLSEAETVRMVKACKKHGISVSAACHVALAQTVLSYTADESERSRGYTTVMAVNMRPYLPAPYNSRAHACQTYVASVTPTVSVGSSFLDVARALGHEYHTWCTPQLRRALHWIYRYHYQKTFGPKDHSSQKPRLPSGVTLSSLGVVEKHLKHCYGHDSDSDNDIDGVRVTSFRFGVSMMTRQALLYVWTFQNKLTLSLDYNEAYHSDQKIQEVLERVAEELFRGLGQSLK